MDLITFDVHSRATEACRVLSKWVAPLSEESKVRCSDGEGERGLSRPRIRGVGSERDAHLQALLSPAQSRTISSAHVYAKNSLYAAHVRQSGASVALQAAREMVEDLKRCREVLQTVESESKGVEWDDREVRVGGISGAVLAKFARGSHRALCTLDDVRLLYSQKLALLSLNSTLRDSQQRLQTSGKVSGSLSSHTRDVSTSASAAGCLDSRDPCSAGLLLHARAQATVGRRHPDKRHGRH